MPANSEHVMTLTRKMKRSMKFSEDADRRAEVGLILEKHCASDAHAEAVVAEMIRSLREFPTISETWEFIEQTEAPTVLGKADPNCNRCAGGNLDWVPNARGGVQRCPCRGRG